MKSYNGDKKGIIFRSNVGSTKDGPGLRYLVYFKGCNFSCLYCGNPESWSSSKSIMTHDRGIDRSVEVVGEERSVDEVIRDVLGYKGFYGKRGGVTITGGEPTLQLDFCRELLKGLKHYGINTAIETNGSSPFLEELLDHLDLVICDLKHMDEGEHVRLTGKSNRQTLKNIKIVCERNKPLWVRIPVIPTINDSDENIGTVVGFLSPMRDKLSVELIAYNKLGVYKWAALGKEYPLEGIDPPTLKEMDEIRERIEGSGIRVITT